MATRTRRTRTRKQESIGAESKMLVYVKGHGEDSEELVPLEVQKFEVEPAYVRVSAGVTKSTGDYESLRVDVSVTAPCYMEQVDEVFERIADDVAEKLEIEVEKYLGSDGEDD